MFFLIFETMVKDVIIPVKVIIIFFFNVGVELLESILLVKVSPLLFEYFH